MTDQPDFAALARQYLDLWEDQITAMAANPELAEQTARFFDTMQQFGANPMAAPGLAALMAQMTGTPAQPTTDQTDGPTDRPAAASGTAAATAAHPDRDQRLVELTRRLADVEERLDRLESGRRTAGGKTAKKPAARKPKSG